jgi:hypothetical protein
VRDKRKEKMCGKGEEGRYANGFFWSCVGDACRYDGMMGIAKNSFN